MKRLIALSLAVLLLGVLAVPVHAAATMQMSISPSAATADPGDEITFTVTISGSEECGSFGLVLEYDTAVYEMVEGACTAEGALFKIFDPERGFAVQFAEAKVPESAVGTFTLKVKSDAPAGAAEVSGTPAVKNGSTTISSDVTAASVTILGDTASDATAATESTAPKQTDPTEEAPKQTQPKSTAPEQTEPETMEAEAVSSNQTEQNVQETMPLSRTDGEETVPKASTEPYEEQDKSESGSWLGAIIIALTVICAGLAALVIIRKRKMKE